MQFKNIKSLLFSLLRSLAFVMFFVIPMSQLMANSSENELPPILLSPAENINITCDSFINVNNRFNDWISTLGGAEVDGFCGSWVGFAAVPGSYDTLDFSSFPGESVNGYDPISCPSSIAGILRHETVDFVFYDGCDNVLVSTASFNILDTTAPEIHLCPINTTYTIDDDKCFIPVTIIAPLITDDCGELLPHVNRRISKTLTASTPDVNTIVDSILYRFGPFNLNASPALSDGTISFKLVKIDGNLVTEYFTIVSETGDVMGVTPQTNEECVDTFISIVITKEQINNWSEDGFIDFHLYPNITADPILAINDICNGSSVAATLDFDIELSNKVSYAIRINGGQKIYLEDLSPFDTILTTGNNQIEYFIQDCALNETSCSSVIQVNEITPPVIECFEDITLSTLLGECSYEYILPANIDYSDNCSNQHVNLHFYVTGASNYGIQYITSQENSVILNKGINTITIVSFDAFSNTDTCKYNVSIIDEELPQIECKSDTLYIDFSEELVYTLNIGDYLVSSSDNCTIDNMAISPLSIGCEMIGNNVDVNINIWDDSENMSSCISNVFVKAKDLIPTSSIVKCQGDTLFLFSNMGINSDQFTYQWTGPNEFNSNEENPVIINPTNQYVGIYHLVISTNNNCSTSGDIAVDFNILNNPIILNEMSTICIMDSLTLYATTYNSNVQYNWYEGNYTNSVFLGSSNFNNFTVSPSVGLHDFYVIVSNHDCTTDPSPLNQIESIIKPIAKIKSILDKVCEGDMIQLESDLALDPDFFYQWIGPNNYYSSEQNSKIQDATMAEGGTYKFLMIKGFCSSDTSEKVVIINETPEKPIISSSGLFCESGPVQLNIENIDFADKFYWSKDGTSYSTTNENELLIANANVNLNGKWKVQVKLGDCLSDTSYSHEIIIEENLVIDINGPDSACVGDTISFTAPFFANAIYQWTGPNEFNYDQQNPELLAIQGEYQLEVTTENNCTNTANLFLQVDAIPVITTISNDGTACMDGETDINFSASIFPNANYTYHWTGPNNFMSSLSNPILPNADSTDNGYYSLVINNAQCSSKPDSSIVFIINQPEQPEITIENAYCLGSDVMLTINEELGNNIQFIWSTPTGQIITNEAFLNITSVGDIHTGTYTVSVQRDDCPSISSEPVSLNIRALPEPITINGDINICEGESIELTANNLNLNGYEWKGPNSFTATGTSVIINNFNTLNAGPYFVRIFDGFCYSEWSTPKVITMQSLPDIAAIDSITSAACIGLDGSIDICLDENTVSTGATYHIYESSQNILIKTSNSLCFSIEDYNLLHEGDNELYVKTEVNGCISANSDIKIVHLDEIPDEKAFILGDDEVHLCEESLLLTTNATSDIDVLWFSPNEIVFSNMDQNMTTVSDLEYGSNPIYLSYTFNSCIDYSIDTLNVVLEDTPIANDDVFEIDYNTKTDLDILDNDEWSSTYVIHIDTTDLEGINISIKGDLIELIPNQSYVGDVSFEYQICNAFCEELCTSAFVSLSIGNKADCFATNIITPNRDDINDYFTVPCLESGLFPNNKLIIFNQWGKSVYESNNYQNNWSGTYNEQDLPSGTYYYVLNLGNSQEEIIKGFLVIER